MLGSFKIRMLAVIIIVLAAGGVMQSSSAGKMMVEPAIRYVLKDYGFNNSIRLFIENITPAKEESLPVASSATLQLPCQFSAVARNYGWYYNEEQGEQEFLPGVYLRVKNNTAVKPIMAGEVQAISQNEEGRTILIKHNEAFYSLYGGFTEVLVEENSSVNLDSILGKSGNMLYLEISNDEGPLNPYNLLNTQK